LDKLELQDSFYRRAAQIYLELGNYRDLSATFNSLAECYLRENQHDRGLKILNEALLYCEVAQQRGQDITLVLASINREIGTYYRVKGRLDSALLYSVRGATQEMYYWRRSALYKASEARQLHRNEQQEKLLVDQEKQLRAERTRGYGLIVFFVLVLLLSMWTIKLYRELKKSNELTKNQAIELLHTNDQLEEALQVQVMMKAELQHRVKNNMQLILGIFSRGRNNIDDPEIQRMLRTQQEQIRSILLLHQRMNLNSTEREIKLAAYLGDLVTNLERSYSGVSPNVKLHLDLNVDLIHIDAAVPLGLILNELVTNAYKYAFPEGRSGNIRITFSKDPDHFFLRVADDGVGLPDDVASRRNSAMGTRLIWGLTRQLEGDIEWISANPGTAVQLKFRAFLNVIT
ncbi:MAG: sensor histidine kinase, partial [Bacteroidota bacterium]